MAAPNHFVRPLCLRAFVVWFVAAGYDYQLIVITKCRRYQDPAPEKLFTPARLSLALRPDRPTAPECERVHMRARLANDAIVPGWPLPRNDSTDAA
jgi:hypothetical protein